MSSLRGPTKRQQQDARGSTKKPERLWLPLKGRYETDAEYRARIAAVAEAERITGRKQNANEFLSTPVPSPTPRKKRKISSGTVDLGRRR